MVYRQFAQILILVPLLFASPLLASGGGGGGGSASAPSDSAPQYDPAAEYQKGLAALKAMNFKGAKIAFDRVIPYAGKDANTFFLAGTARVGLDDWKGARKMFERATKIDPNMVPAQRNLGIAYAKTGDAAKAQGVIDLLSGKLTSCNGQCDALNEAAGAIKLELAGTPVTSQLEARNLLFASAASGDRFYLDAVGLINEHRYEDAIAALKSAQQSFGPHPDILTYLGFANRKLKRYDIAESYYLAALAAAPGHRGATEYYGELMVERGQLADARAMLAKLDMECHFGCAEAEELRHWVVAGHSPHSS